MADPSTREDLSDLSNPPGAPAGDPARPWPAKLVEWRAEHAAAAPICANCGAALEGPYCHACGQPAEDFDRSLRSLLAEGFEHLFHADLRLFHTLPLLALKPARLTREYLAGRRYSQTPPLRLFLVVVLLVFLAGNLKEAAHPAGPLIQRDSPSETAVNVRTDNPTWGAFAAWLRPRLAYEQTHKREFAMALEGWMHQIAIIFLPVSTLLLGLLFVFNRRVFLYDHAVFSMHSLSFMGLLFTTGTLLSLAAPLAGLAGLLFLAVPIHLFIHLRGVYNTSILGALIRMLLLFFLSLIAVTILFVAVFALDLNGMGVAR